MVRERIICLCLLLFGVLWFADDVGLFAVEKAATRGETRLILDRASVAQAEGVRFCLNQARKHPENPILFRRYAVVGCDCLFHA